MRRIAPIAALTMTAAVALAPAAAAAQGRAPAGETPGVLTEPVLRVRLTKLGYTNVQRLTRVGDYWEAVVSKGGTTQTLRFHALSNARIEGPIPVQRALPVPRPVSSPG
jgi:hypothetical protein